MANSDHKDEISPLLPLNPGRNEAPIKILDKENSNQYQLGFAPVE
jgi:hypothetical protein